MTVAIRPFAANDWPRLWPMLHATFAAGDTYTFAPDAPEESIFKAWIELPLATFVAGDDAGAVLGSYYLKANQPGHGGHVANCGFVVAASARGQGIASRMCEHAQATALARGFLAMQFNFVVSSNHDAIRLWRKLGFEIVGTLPRAFRHPQWGLVDAHVMYKWLAG